ncbi:hypothetical protein STENM223S_10481 [Streptomyces tendae]
MAGSTRPTQTRVCGSAHSGDSPRLGEGGRVHARVDRTQLGAVRPAAFLPAAGVCVAGRDHGRLPIGLGGQPAVEGGEQGPYRGRGIGFRQVVGPQSHAVLGHQQGDVAEVPGEQPRQGGRAAGGRVAQVHRAEVVVLVPVQGQGAQGAFEARGHGQQVGNASPARGAVGAGRTAGAFEGAHGGLRAQRGGQSALVPGEFGETVQGGGETVRLKGRPAVRHFLRARGRVPGSGGAQGGGQLAVVLGEAPARAPPEDVAVVLGLPERGGAHPPDLRRQRDPSPGLLAFAAAERVDVELVLLEAAHEPVAPGPGLTAHIRIATLRKQSDAHARTPDLPFGEPPLARRLAAGRTYADKQVARWTVVHRATRRGERS